MSRVLVVIPTFNERANIATLIERIMRLSVEVDVLVVDDNSPDGTAEAVREKQRAFGERRVQLLLRTGGKAGRGSACLAGMRLGLGNGYRVAIEMDADLSHDPSDIPRLLAGLSVADVVIGSKYVRGGRVVGCQWYRKFLSRMANAYTRVVLRVPIRDYTNGFRCYGERALALIPQLTIDGVGFTVIPQISYQLYQRGMTFREIPVVFHNRRVGTSNMSSSEILESFFAVLKIRSNRLYVHAKQILKFGMTGIVNGFVDVGMLAFFIEVMRVPLRRAVVMSGVLALVTAFLFNAYRKFRDTDERYTLSSSRLLCVYGSSFVLGVVLTIFFVEVLGMWYLFARILVVPFVALWNYPWLYRRAFRRVPAAGGSAP